jgi:hypothetical protein
MVSETWGIIGMQEEKAGLLRNRIVNEKTKWYVHVSSH